MYLYLYNRYIITIRTSINSSKQHDDCDGVSPSLVAEEGWDSRWLPGAMLESETIDIHIYIYGWHSSLQALNRKLIWWANLYQIHQIMLHYLFKFVDIWKIFLYDIM